MRDRTTCALCYLITIAIIIATAACGQSSQPANVIPYTGETHSVTIELDAWDSELACRGVTYDPVKIREIVDCLTPLSEGRINTLIPIGRIIFHGPHGEVRAEFGDEGMNPLCVRIGRKLYVRDAVGYLGNRADHRRLYQTDANVMAEGLAFYRKMRGMCKKLETHPESEPHEPPEPKK
jgi:hypothetical protein